MKMFGNLSSDGLAETGDRLGGPGLFDSGIYTGTIKLAYSGQSAGGAQSMTVLIDIQGREFRKTFYVTNKKGENYFVTKAEPNVRQPMTDYVLMNEMCQLATGYELKDSDFEDKVVSIYDYELKKEIPTNVPVLIDVIGKPITVAVFRDLVDKQAKDSSGEYKNTGDTREQNVIDKFFHAESGRTVTEFKQNITEAVHMEKWRDKFAGKTRNQVKGAEGNVGVPGGQKSAAVAAGGPAKSLFSNA